MSNHTAKIYRDEVISTTRCLMIDRCPKDGLGLSAAVGSLAIDVTCGPTWKKTGAGDKDWAQTNDDADLDKIETLIGN